MRLRLIGYSFISFLLISPTCVQVNDRQNRKEEINNAAQSLGEHVLWKKIEKAKAVIDETYQKIHALQDSIDQAKYIAQSVVGLGVASIENELLQIHDMKMDVDAYVAGIPDNLYGAKLKNLYERPDVEVAAHELADMLYYSDQLPKETKQLQNLLTDANNFRAYFQEFADKRAMQAAHMYRKWARLYREKGIELSQRVLQDKALTMTDYERIQTQHIAQSYIVMSYEFIEKGDSILLSITEHKDAIRSLQKNQLGAYLFTKKLFQ